MVPIAERFEAETQLDGSEMDTWFDIPAVTVWAAREMHRESTRNDDLKMEMGDAACAARKLTSSAPHQRRRAPPPLPRYNVSAPRTNWMQAFTRYTTHHHTLNPTSPPVRDRCNPGSPGVLPNDTSTCMSKPPRVASSTPITAPPTDALTARKKKKKK